VSLLATSGGFRLACTTVEPALLAQRPLELRRTECGAAWCCESRREGEWSKVARVRRDAAIHHASS
jgi:hypothetical protein